MKPSKEIRLEHKACTASVGIYTLVNPDRKLAALLTADGHIDPLIYMLIIKH